MERDIDPTAPNLKTVTDFLSEMFDRGVGYSAINTAKSAISNLAMIDNKPIGEHRLVKRYMKGIFNLKPSLPKTNVTWDPQIVLNHIKTLSPTESLNLKELTQKFVSLLWLLSGQRGQAILLISVKNITVNDSYIKIRFGDILKTTRPGFHQKEVMIKAYEPDRRLCIVTVAKCYLEKTKVVRGKEMQLFISYQKPHNAVSRETISRWISLVMSKAGLDMSVFSPHSLRAASSSKAMRAKVPINTILETAGWARESTFRAYYNKPVKEGGQFAMALLENH